LARKVLPLPFSMVTLDYPEGSRKYCTKELASGRQGKKHPFAILNQVKRPLIRPSRLTSQQHSEDATSVPRGARSSL